MFVAGGYPHEWMAAVAYDLRNRWPVAQLAAGMDDAAALPIIERFVEDAERTDVPLQPIFSRAAVQYDRNGIILALPALGMKRCPGAILGLLLGLLLTVIGIVGSAVIIAAALVNGEFLALVVLPCSLALTGAGMACVAYALDVGGCHGQLAVVGDELLILRIGAWKARQYEWRREEIAAIRADSRSGDFELRISPKAGKTVGLFTGRNAQELQWIAAVLRATLNVPAYRVVDSAPE
jgi:hypothetical protein